MRLLSLPDFNGGPTSVQFAKAGHWERAGAFAPDAVPSDAELEHYLAGKSEVAFESFYGDCYFKARVQGLDLCSAVYRSG